MVPNQDWLDEGFLPLVMIDANEAMEKLQADAASHGADASRSFPGFLLLGTIRAH